MEERLQKILSGRGVASRRKAEEYITQGLVKVNGRVATLGQKADPEVDEITVDGKVLQARKEMLYYVMNKPVGIETSNVDTAARLLAHLKKTSAGKARAGDASKLKPQTVHDLLPQNLRGKIYPVGRLDKDSEGLLLLSNDGVLAYRLTHPKFDHEKVYEVETAEPISESSLEKMRRGMVIKGEKTKKADVEKIGPRSFRISLTEGKNRQIRRMCDKVDNPVKSLKRIKIMTLEDPSLKTGQLRPLTAPEKAALLASVGL